MADFDLIAMADALEAILVSLGVPSIQNGVPERISTRVSAYITQASITNDTKVSAVNQAEVRQLVTFSYRVDASEEGTERDLMIKIRDFIATVYQDRTLGGTVANVSVDAGLADLPEYQMRAGDEYREYPVLVMGTQRYAYNVNP